MNSTTLTTIAVANASAASASEPSIVGYAICVALLFMFLMAVFLLLFVIINRRSDRGTGTVYFPSQPECRFPNTNPNVGLSYEDGIPNNLYRFGRDYRA